MPLPVSNVFPNVQTAGLDADTHCTVPPHWRAMCISLTHCEQQIGLNIRATLVDIFVGFL